MKIEAKRKRRAQRQTIVFLPDIHFPHHDRRALAAALALCADLQPEIIVILGDLLDCYAVSRFDKDPGRVHTLQSEFDMGRTFLENLRKAHPNARIILKEGNHEERLQRYLWSKAPALASLRAITVPEQLGCEALAVEWHSAKDRLNLHGLVITHGSIVRQRSGYTAHGELFHRGRSGISGHTHRLAHIWRTTDGGKRSWVEAGCLCRLDPDYGADRAPDWQHGLVIGHSMKAHDIGRLDLTIVPISHGVAHYKGRLYDKDGIHTP